MPMKDIDAHHKLCVIDSYGKLFELENGKKEIAMSVKVKSVTTNNDAVFIIDEHDKLWTYGNGSYGKLGHGNNGNKTAPTIVENLKEFEVKQISVNNDRVVCTTTCDKAFAWGFCARLGLSNSEKLPVELIWDHKK